MSMKHRLIASSALILAALACNAPSATDSTATLAAIVPTITASALTPSQVATLAATPTQFSASTSAPAGECPAAGSASLPTVPPTFAQYADTIEAYLSDGGSIDGLRSTLAAWGGIDDQAGSVTADRDLTGDGTPEVVIAVQAPIEQFPNFMFPPGDLYVYACSDGAYTLIYGDYSTPDRPTPDVIAVEDVNQNGRADLVYTTHYCGAHTCMFDTNVMEWNSSTSVFSALLDVTGVPSATITVENQDGGTSEIVIDEGAVGSAGAGPQILRTYTYIWNGTAFELGRSDITTPIENWYPIHYLMIGDDLMDEGCYECAIGRYQEMIDLPDPRTLSSEDEIPALEAYARYRIMVAHVLRGDSAAAQSVYEGLFAEYDAAPSKPGAGFAGMADVFWNTFMDGGIIGASCAAVEQYATNNPDSYAPLNQFGYENKLYEPANLCPFE